MEGWVNRLNRPTVNRVAADTACGFEPHPLRQNTRFSTIFQPFFFKEIARLEISYGRY
jgi:hypothetical protein